MVRETSSAIYHKIKDEGLLGRLQFAVYDVLFTSGPLTQNELHKWHFANTQPRNIQPRVSELVNRGVVRCVGERECRITGRTCMIWDVTSTLPIAVLPTHSTRKTLEILWQELQETKAKTAQEIDALRSQLTQLKEQPFKYEGDGQGRFA